MKGFAISYSADDTYLVVLPTPAAQQTIVGAITEYISIFGYKPPFELVERWAAGWEQEIDLEFCGYKYCEHRLVKGSVDLGVCVMMLRCKDCTPIIQTIRSTAL